MQRFIRRLIIPGLALALVVSAGIVLLVSSHASAHDVAGDVCPESLAYCPAHATDELSGTLEAFKTPDVTEPKPPLPAVTYSVISKGTLSITLADFKARARQVLTDPRGWAQLGVRFVETEGEGQFTLVIAEADQVPSYSSGCDTYYNCNVGRYVIINQDRWLNGTPPWNQAGKSSSDYHHLAINHELGHWLGHGHPVCSGAGQPAPVMMQQSIDLGGCTFNPWPTASELWSTRLGVSL